MSTKYLHESAENKHLCRRVAPSLEHSTVDIQSRRNTRVSIDLSSKGTLAFQHISYTVNKRQIIDDISGCFKAGMNAIMGKTRTIILMR